MKTTFALFLLLFTQLAGANTIEAGESRIFSFDTSDFFYWKPVDPNPNPLPGHTQTGQATLDYNNLFTPDLGLQEPVAYSFDISFFENVTDLTPVVSYNISHDDSTSINLGAIFLLSDDLWTDFNGYAELVMTSGKINVNDFFVTVDVDGSTYTTNPALVPIPAAIWLFASGILVLSGLARKQSRS